MFNKAVAYLQSLVALLFNKKETIKKDCDCNKCKCHETIQ